MYRALNQSARAERMLRLRASRSDPRRVRNWAAVLLLVGFGIWFSGPYSFVGLMLTFVLVFGLMRLLFVAHRWHERVLLEWEARAHDPYS